MNNILRKLYDGQIYPAEMRDLDTPESKAIDTEYYSRNHRSQSFPKQTWNVYEYAGPYSKSQQISDALSHIEYILRQ